MIKKFDANKIEPKGWILDQLDIQKKGLSGNLDKVWRDIRDSAWIGGDAESWERMPYFLDGFIPLGYLTKDEDIKARAKKYVYAIVERQKEDGWICPSDSADSIHYDVWALFLIGKVLTVWLDFNDDGIVYNALYRAMKCLYNKLKAGTVVLFDWAKLRWFEALIPLKYLYNVKKESWIKECAEILEKQGEDFPSLMPLWVKPLNKWTQQTHVVNLAMMLKYEPLTRCFRTGTDKNISEKLYKFLTEYNGTVVGTITGDECLAGQNPSRGFELCSVAELMYSFECLYEMTGKKAWLDRLERVAFNALPATVSEDMWTHQYDQQVNQISCVKNGGTSYFGTNGDEANLFGLEPHFGCCTSNFNQAWPKLAMNGCLKHDYGYTVAIPFPARYSDGNYNELVEIEVSGNYPFENKFEITVNSMKKSKFELKIRIPDWAEDVKLISKNNVEPIKDKEYLTIEKTWFGVDKFSVEFLCKPRFIKRPNNLKAVRYGALVFALPIKTEYVMKEYVKDGVERKFPYCDYELKGTSPWNYGFASTEDEIKVESANYGKVPFSFEYPRITLKAKMKKVEWDYAPYFETVANPTPVSNKAIGLEEEITLIPYGSAKLRMTEMPLTK